MKKLLLLSLFLLSACAPFPTYPEISGDLGGGLDQTPLFAGAVFTGEPLESPAASQNGQDGAFVADSGEIFIQTPQETATPDFGLTQAAEIRADNRTHDAVVLLQKQADAEKARTDAARVDAQNTQSTKNQEAAKAADTNRLTSEANEITVLSIQATQTWVAPALVLTAVRAENERQYGWLNSTGIFLISIALLFLAVVMGYLVLTRAPAAVPEEQEGIPELEPENYVRTINRSSGTTTFPTVFQGYIPPEIATDQQLEWVANGILRDGKKLSHSYWTPDWKNGFSEPKFAAFQYFLVKFGLAVWQDATRHQDGVKHTADFEKHFTPLMTDGPSGPQSPTADIFAPDDGNQPVKKSIDTHVDTKNTEGESVPLPSEAEETAEAEIL